MLWIEGSAKVTRSSTEAVRSPLRSLRALHENALSAASRTNIPPMTTTRTSAFSPSQPTVKSNGISVTRSPSTKFVEDSEPEEQPARRSNKRKRDSESDSRGSSQLREAQEKVEQKRAKIAARVPSAMAPGNHKPTLKKVTSLADLYARLHRDSGASGQEDASNVPLSPKAARIVNRPRRSSSPGRSPASSPDPIALTAEDDQEVILVKHIRASPSRPKPMSPLINLAHLSQSLRLKTSASAPRPDGTTPNGVSKSPDKPRKSMPDFAVVVNPPPKRATPKKKSRELDAPRPRDVSPPPPTPSTAPLETPREKSVSKVPETIVLDTPTPTPPSTPPPRMQAAETLTESPPELGVRRSRRVITYLNGSSLTSEDIDALLDATPVPFDLTPSCAHLSVGDDSKDKPASDDKVLWWRQPAFEARAKADIQRSLRLLLPADPAEDPPPPIGEGAGRWRAEVRPRQLRAKMWAERLEDAFGLGPLERGLGRKPRRGVARPASAARRKGEGKPPRPPTIVPVNTLSYGHVRGILKPPSRRRSPSPSLNDTDNTSVVFNDITNADVPNESEEAAAWTVALLPLVKGKTTMDKAGMARTSDTLGKVERASDRGLINLGTLKESSLADTVRRLSELEDVPLGDTHSLRDRARTLAERWREKFGDGLLSS